MPSPTLAFLAHDGAVFSDHLPDLIQAAQTRGFNVVCLCPREGAARLHSINVTHVAVPASSNPDPLRSAATWLLTTSACIEHRSLLLHSFSHHLAAAFAARAAQVPAHVATALHPNTLAERYAWKLASSRADVWPVHARHESGLGGKVIKLQDDRHVCAQGGFGVNLTTFAPPLDRSVARARSRASLKLPPRRHRWIGYVGPLDPDHGDELHAILDAVAARDATVGTVIVPRGADHPAEHTRLRARADYGDAVLLLADRRPDEVAVIYNALDLLIAPTVRASLDRAIEEASAMRLPAVAYAHPSVIGRIDDRRTGRLVPGGDRAALVAVALDLLGSGHARRALGAAARAQAQLYSDARSHHQALFALYDRLIARNPVR